VTFQSPLSRSESYNQPVYEYSTLASIVDETKWLPTPAALPWLDDAYRLNQQLNTLSDDLSKHPATQHTNESALNTSPAL